jgi:signal transduction histidine kinase
LLPDGVTTVFEDDKGLRWVGTANGISVFDPAGSRSSFLPLVAASDRESNNRMGGVYYDETSATYFVCAQDPALVFVINPFNGTIKKISAGADGEKFYQCHTIKRDRDNRIWLLTADRIYQWDRGREVFEVFPVPGERKDYLFRDVLKDSEGNYWFASYNEGVLFYNTVEKKFIPVRDSSVNGIRTSTGFAEDTVNGLIIGSSFGEGVWIYNLASGKATGYYETALTPDYGQLNLVNGITADRKGKIWLATYSGGLFRYNPGQVFEKTFTRFDMRDGLSSNSVLSVSSDRDTTLWLLTGKGISAVSNAGKLMYDLGETETFGFSSYTSDARFPHDLYYNPQKEELLLGAGGGLFFYTLRKRNSIPRFPVTVTALQLNGKEVFPDSIDKTGLRLPFHSNTLSAAFAGLYYGNEQGIRYEYKLENYDTEWIQAGNRYSVLYQNLPPGRYRLKIRAVTAAGVVAGETGNIYLRVVPPFWRTWWFIALALLLSVSVIWWVIYSLQTRLRMERIINEFATSLYGQNTTEDILWDTAKNCIDKLGFVDCVIYLRNEKRNVLVQTAAYGPKNPHRREIINKIEIPVGRGVVGWVAGNGRPVIIKDTAADERYIVDDERRLSEIAVPVLVDQKVFAVIDSEHPQRNFYTRYHLKVLTKIAANCAERVSKYLNEERLRAKIARDLHDEMGSTLTSINIISKVAMEEQKDNGKLNMYFSKIKEHSGRMMESMSDMVWAINPVNDNFEKVILKMKEFVAEMLEPARINFRVEESGPLETTFLNPEQRRDIYLILKESVNNIVKYSGASEVVVRLQRNEQLLQMEIRDNGRGFDIKAQRAGNGLKNMHSRAEEMGAILKIDAVPGNGTVVWMELTV